MGAKLGLFLKATSIYCYHHIGKISLNSLELNYLFGKCLQVILIFSVLLGHIFLLWVYISISPLLRLDI